MPNKSKDEKDKQTFPEQKQKRQPGREHKMKPKPDAVDESQQGTGKLAGRVALITGGDSGIGRAVAVAFAREGANVAIVYLEEDKDAEETKRLVEAERRKCLTIKGDVQRSAFCKKAVRHTVEKLGRLDVLVNNAGVQFPLKSLEELTDDQLERTFRTNIYSMFYLTREALPHLKQNKGATIVNSTSVTAYRGSPGLIDYSATKGAIVSFTRSLSGNLAKDGIRVNAVAPGPIWTPLIPSSFDKEKVKKFGSDVPLGRAGQPEECAPAYLYLACDDSSYVTGQVIHVNGGEIING